MKNLTCLLVLLFSVACGDGTHQVGDPCKPDGWCCLDSEYVECRDGILELADNAKGTKVCQSREPGYKPCT